MFIKNRKGFSLIELMIVIAIIGILVAVALPQFASMTEDAKKTKAKQDCDTVAQSIQKYNSLEGAMVENLMDLKGKYLTNIDTLRDPWGNAYQLDPYGGYVYSKGPDGQDHKTIPGDKKNKDNIKVPYIGALTIVAASIEVNPTGESDPLYARDVLHLMFNKKVRVDDPTGTSGLTFSAFSLNDKSVPSTDANLVPDAALVAGKSADKAAENGFAFRWCEGSRSKYIGGESILRQPDADGEPGAGVADTSNISYAGEDQVTAVWQGAIPQGTDAGSMDSVVDGMIFHTEDSQEIVIVLPQGTSGSIIPGTHYINLTGNRKNQAGQGNPLFFEFDGITACEISGSPQKIEVYD